MMTPEILVQLIHLQGGLKGEIQEFSRVPITVGRLSSCTVKFPPNEPAVSRQHATIRREGNRFKLIDHSKFGTFINGKLVDEVFLRSGDVLEFGPGGPKVSVTFEVLAQRPSPVAGPMAMPAADLDAAHPAMEPSPLYQPLSPLAYSPPQRGGASLPQAVQGNEQAPDVSVSPFSPAAFAAAPRALAPLVIQLGPTIRSYRELPVTIGAHDSAEFVLAHPGILDHHAQIFFHDNSYWIKDLTGQRSISVNRMAIDGAVQLAHNDEILCSREGPTFRFLGGGRLAEIAAQQEREPGNPAGPRADGAAGTERAGIFSKLLQRLRGGGWQ